MEAYIRVTCIYFYRPQRSCGQGNIFTPVCHSFCSRGGWGSASVHAGIPPPTPGPDTPQNRHHHPPGPDTSTTTHPPRPDTTTHPGADTPLDQTPPPGADPYPPGSRHPPPGSRLQHTVYERPVRILLECILVVCVLFVFTFACKRKSQDIIHVPSSRQGEAKATY